MDKEQIFHTALEISSPDARQRFLEAACQGDPGLRREIELLLEHDREAGSFLDRPAEVPAATRFHPTGGEEPGDLIAGRYKLLEEIGEGGMGQVWVAQQIAPVHRRVAIKLIKPGMDSRQVLSRFETERQALALMDHPNIAKVLDGGVTDRGRPYFVMEYVKGVSLTEYCDQARLSVEQRLPLFVQVCQAVQHAHQKGIIHRDLKPSNILVCLYDGQPVPKVIDFGLAKATQQPLTEHTLYTAHGAMLGTPLYMSPEQAELNNLDIDTRSDVYSLGVVLYELLTGTTPLDRQRLKEAAWQEIVRLIKEEDPVKPSTKLSGSGTLPTVATQRSLEPAQLCRTIRGDLDWIVMKSLEKDRTRRYETANGLARDIERYLQDAPIEARPPSARYRFRKFARRNRVAIGTAIVLGAALVMGTAVSTWQAVRATRAEQAAKAALDDAEAQRLRAEAAYREARAAVERYFLIVSESQLLNVPGLQPLRKELLEAALEYYEKLASLTDAKGDSTADLAQANLRVGTITSMIGSQDKALAAFTKAVELYEQLAHTSQREYRPHLLSAYERQGITQIGTDHLDQAEATFKKMLALAEQLEREVPQVARYATAQALQRLSVIQYDSGRLDSADASIARASRILTDLSKAHPEEAGYRLQLANSYRLLSTIRDSGGRDTEALTLKLQAVDLFKALVQEWPTVAEYQSGLATQYESLARFHRVRHSPQAQAAYDRSFEIRERLARENPQVISYQSDLAASYLARGDLALLAANPKQAQCEYERAIEIAERISKENPGSFHLDYQLGRTLGHVANFKSRQLRFDEALALSERAVAIGQRLVRANAASATNHAVLASAYGLRGKVHSESGRPAEAERDWEASLAAYDAAWARGLKTADQLSRRGHMLAMLRRWPEAARALADASRAGEPEWRLDFALALIQLAAGEEDAYLANCAKLLARFGDDPRDAVAAAICLCYAAGVGNSAEELEKVLTLAERLVAQNRLNPAYHVLRGAILFRAGQNAEAITVFKQSLPLHSVAEVAMPNYVDAIRASRLVGETLLLSAYHQQGDAERCQRQKASLHALIEQYETKPPRYGEVVAAWTLPLTIHLAKREIARQDGEVPGNDELGAASTASEDH